MLKLIKWGIFLQFLWAIWQTAAFMFFNTHRSLFSDPEAIADVWAVILLSSYCIGPGVFFYIALKNLSVKKVMLVSLALSASWSIFALIMLMIGNEASFQPPERRDLSLLWETNYEITSGTILFQAIDTIVAFTYNSVLIGIILLLKKIRTRNFKLPLPQTTKNF
ncbi:MAG: hypothetical protein LBR56_05870 [Sporomusaceae bacterium]|nr:hypothetical protein [Sporomusaceae bacterium]